MLREISVKETALTNLEEQTEELKKRVSAITEEKLQLEADRNKRDKVMQDKNQELLTLERECARLEQKKLAVEMEEKQIIDRLWDTYEMTRSAAMAIRAEMGSVTEARKRISEIKRNISQLGNPNIGAIDEYERVNTRYTYLTEQRDDVEGAKTELLSIIREIHQ